MIYSSKYSDPPQFWGGSFFDYYHMDSSERTKFRNRKEWKDFRKKLIEERGAECELCGTRYSGKRTKSVQVHHLDPDAYTDLLPFKFVLLCSSDHDLVERICKKVMSKTTELANKEKWFILLHDALPFMVREKLEEQIATDKRKEMLDM